MILEQWSRASAPPKGSPGLLLEVRNLCTVFRNKQDATPVLKRVNFAVRQNETLGLVGESGCGKTVTALSILGLFNAGEIVEGEIIFNGSDLRKQSLAQWRRVRGRRIALVFQEPAAALNPVIRIGDQLAEGMCEHLRLDRRLAWEKGVALLDQVGLPQPAASMRAYPHQLSGGMKQRTLIAIALACDPSLVIADEPTTALDTVTQRRILDLLRRLKTEKGLTLILISHDLGVVAQMADRIAVMHAGEIVEIAPTGELFARPSHPYTRRLLQIAIGFGENQRKHEHA